MFNLTKDKNINLPSAIMVDGRFYAIRCTVKDGIEFTEELKKKTHLVTDFDFLFINEKPDNMQNGLDALIKFFYPKKEFPKDVFPHTDENVIIYDYMKDADLIWAAFYQNYTIDLLDEYNKMHWYIFKCLFESLRDCKLVDVMGYRTYSEKDNQDNKTYKKLLKSAWEILPEIELTEKQKESANKFDVLCKV